MILFAKLSISHWDVLLGAIRCEQITHMISTKILEAWRKKVLVCGSSDSPKTQHSVHAAYEVVDTTCALVSCGPREGANNERSTTSPGRWQIWNGLSPEHPGYVAEVQEEERGFQHPPEEDGERKRCHLGKTASGSRLTERCFLVLVTVCHFLPRHPHSIRQKPQDF